MTIKHNPYRTPIFIPRWVLTGVYVGFAILGGFAIRFGSPTIELANADSYTIVWGWAVVVTGLIAAAGSWTELWERLERIGNLMLSLTLVFYATLSVILILTGQHQPSAAVFTGIVVMMAALPLGRGVYLLTRSGLGSR